MGWRADGGLWLLVRGGGLYLSKGTGVSKLYIFFVNFISIIVLNNVGHLFLYYESLTLGVHEIFF